MLPSTLVLAWKVLTRRKLFTAISLFGVALTLLVLVVASALVDHVFAPRSPERRFDRVLGVWSLEMAGEHWRYSGFAGYAALAPLAGIPGVEEMTIASMPRLAQAWVDGREVRARVRRTDAAYWRVLDFRFLDGEPWSVDDDREGRPVAVIGAATRAAIFGDADAVGRRFTLGGRELLVVGVVDDVPAVRVAGYADVWVPLASSPSSTWRSEQRGNLVALLLARDRAAFPLIQAEVRARFAAMTPTEAGFATLRGDALPLFEAVARQLFGDASTGSSQRSTTALPPSEPTGPARAPQLVVLLVALGLVFMTLPAVNLANIHHSRIRERAVEIGVRRAFGAPRGALLLQFLLENLVLTGLGAAIGLAAAALVLAALNASGAIAHADFAVNWRVAATGAAAALVFALVSGLYPAWRMARLSPVPALRGRS